MLPDPLFLSSRSTFTRLMAPLALAGVLFGGGIQAAQAQNPMSTVKDAQGNKVMRIFDNGNLTLFENGKFTTPGEIESTGGGFRLPDNTLVDDASDLGQLALPFSGETSSSGPAFELKNTGSGDAISILNAGDNAIHIHDSGSDGIRLCCSGGDGLDVRSPANDGLRVTNAGVMGVRVNNPGSAGVLVNNSTNQAVRGIHSSGNVGELGTADYGVHGVSTHNRDNAGYFEMSTTSGTALSAIHRGDGNAIAGTIEGGGFAAVFGQTVSGASGDAVVGQALGSGFAGVFEASVNADARGNPGANVALIKNNSSGDGGDVLALQAGETDGNIQDNTNFITFYGSGGGDIGALEGMGGSGVHLSSGGADFAEELPVAGGSPTPEPTDLVSVRGGKVSLSTKGAGRLMIVSSTPVVTGNTTPSAEGDDNRRVPVAFVGQVPVRLRGKAEVGDLIVASGNNDGTARAVSPSEYRREKHGPIAGQAWSAKSTSKVGTVTVAVGLGRSGAVAEQLQAQKGRIDELEQRLAALETQGSSSTAVAGLSGPWLLLVLFGLGGGLGAGLLWRRR